MKRVRAAAAVAMTAAAVLLSASPAYATYPGENGRIAFRRYFNSAHTWGTIFTIKPNGTGLLQLTHPPRGVVLEAPDWSRNGRWIAYHRTREGRPTHIFRMRRNGSDRRDLSRGNCQPDTCAGDSLPSWSRDGRKIAFSRSYPTDPDEPNMGISIIRRDGTHYREVTRPSLRFQDVGPNWSPDGDRLVFVRHVVTFCKCTHDDDHAIFTVRRDGSHLRRITPWHLQGSNNPDWSPNGRWILFSDVRFDRPRNVWMIHPNGTGLHRVTSNPEGRFRWGKSTFSPDGKRIVTSRGGQEGEPGSNPDIYVMNLDGSGMRRVTISPRWDSFADWGPRRK
jgi:Tol biopolymer transport system component